MLAVSTLLATSLVSCKDQNMQGLTVAPDGPTVVDGHLKFASLASFQSFIKANEGKTAEQLMQMNRDINFVSHLRLSSEPDLALPRPVYPSTLHCLQTNSRMMTTTGSTPKSNAGAAATINSLGASMGYADEPLEYQPVIGVVGTDIIDPLLDATLDENRELVINTVTYRAGNDYSFFYPVGHPELVDDFFQKIDTGEISIADADMHVYGDLVVQKTNLMSYSDDAATTNVVPFFGNRSVEGVANWDGNHRIECQIWQGNWFLYASSGIKTHATQYAKKWVFFKGWVDFNPDQVTANANVTYTIPPSLGGNGTQTSAMALEVSETNAAVAVKRFDYRTAIVGYTNQGAGVVQTIRALLSDMTVTVNDPRATVKGATLTLNIDKLTSVHTGRWGTNTITRTLTW